MFKFQPRLWHPLSHRNSLPCNLELISEQTAKPVKEKENPEFKRNLLYLKTCILNLASFLSGFLSWHIETLFHFLRSLCNLTIQRNPLKSLVAFYHFTQCFFLISTFKLGWDDVSVWKGMNSITLTCHRHIHCCYGCTWCPNGTNRFTRFVVSHFT